MITNNIDDLIVVGETFLSWIKGKPCIVCGQPGVPHHYGKEGKGVSQKCLDIYVIPLCNDCHVEDLHRFGQKSFETKHGISLDEWNQYYRQLFYSEFGIDINLINRKGNKDECSSKH